MKYGIILQDKKAIAADKLTRGNGIHKEYQLAQSGGDGQKNENEIKIIVNVRGCNGGGLSYVWTFYRSRVFTQFNKCNQWEQREGKLRRKDTRIYGNRTS